MTERAKLEIAVFCLAVTVLGLAVTVLVSIGTLSTEDDVKIAESHCIDGIVVIADGNVIGCVNGTQAAGNTWVPR